MPSNVKQHVDCVVGHTSFPLQNRPLFLSSSSVSADAPVTPVTLRQRYNISANLLPTNENKYDY